MQLLDPKNDYVFKRLFADAPDLLQELINAIRHDCPPIRSLTVLNPAIHPAEIQGKHIVLDVRAEDSTGTVYNVEIQVKRFAAWGKRSAYYLARMLSQQMEQGDQYDDIAPVIGVHLLDFDLLPDYPKNFAWRFEMRDHKHGNVRLGNELQLDILELRKADRQGVAREALRNWVAFIKHWEDLMEPGKTDYDPVLEAIERLKELSKDDEARRLAFVRERAMFDEASLLHDARTEGRAEGRAATQRDIARNLILQTGLKDEQIASATGVSVDDVRVLREAGASET